MTPQSLFSTLLLGLPIAPPAGTPRIVHRDRHDATPDPRMPDDTGPVVREVFQSIQNGEERIAGIALDTGYSTTTIQQSLKALEAMGCITRAVDRHGRVFLEVAQ